MVGKGPAGIAAAAALADQGLSVGVLGPPGPVRWVAQYGAWAGELERVGYGDVVAHRWAESVIAFEGGKRQLLPHAYVRVDRERLAGLLLERCEQGGVRWIDGLAAGIEHSATASELRLQDGREQRARVVIDASGHRPILLSRKDTPPQGFQTAVGLTFEVADDPFPPGQVILMDWSRSHPNGSAAGDVPSFLYAMPLGDGLVFAEETVLVARPAVSFETLEQRLRLRLRSLGIEPRDVRERELCWIPMGGALPERGRTLGFGGAAGMVHPATGYQLTRALDTAPQLAAAVARELDDGGDPARAAEAGWETLWPADRRHRRDLFHFGMELLLRLDPAKLPEFFEIFFDLSDADWQGYWNDRLSAGELATVMGRVFRRSSPAIRAAMIRTAASATGVRLGGTLLSMLRP